MLQSLVLAFECLGKAEIIIDVLSLCETFCSFNQLKELLYVTLKGALLLFNKAVSAPKNGQQKLFFPPDCIYKEFNYSYK